MITVGLPETAALAAVALIGYLFGQRTHKILAQMLSNRRQRELERAAGIAWQLESIAGSLRQELASHHARIASFKRRVLNAQQEGNDGAWDDLCKEAESILGPTMQLGQQLAHAYDEIRQQSDALETFTQGRTDPLTGVGNGRALEQQLGAMVHAAERGTSGFSVALVSLDRSRPMPGESPQRPETAKLLKLAGIIKKCVRDSDFVARYGDEEFVVVMPQTSLAGACVFCDRLRQQVEDQVATTVCCGIAEYQTSDEPKTLLARADSAFYSAKAAGTNRQFVHTGTVIREHHAKTSPKPAEEPAAGGDAVSRRGDERAEANRPATPADLDNPKADAGQSSYPEPPEDVTVEAVTTSEQAERQVAETVL